MLDSTAPKAAPARSGQAAVSDLSSTNKIRRPWAKRLAPFRQAKNGQASFELILTLALFAAVWAATWGLSLLSWWLTPLGVVPASFVLVRLFIIQHDCGHGAMFAARKLNTWAGRLIGVLTMTPYEYWRHSHAVHHAHSGNLDKRGIGDVPTLTIEEYNEKSAFGRFCYRVVRHPLALFGVGPSLIFIIQQRLPIMYMNKGWKYWASTMYTNIGIFMLALAVGSLVGLGTYIAIMLPMVAGAATIGVWLFYVQHQFEETDWERTSDWSHEQFALTGSSYYALPKPLMWLTGNIGIHHVHHMSSGIPFYRLHEVLTAYPELEEASRLTLLESFKCARFKLWDEANKRLVTFKEARAMGAALPVA